jgi:hypothetical protein
MKIRLVWAVVAGMASLVVSLQAQEGGQVFIHKEVHAIGGAPADVLYHTAGPATMDFLEAEMSFDDRPVRGAPYSADAVTETTQTLADGNRITRKSAASLYRDSAGRTRREDTLSAMGPWASSDSPKMIMIHDPAAGVSYHLDPQTHTAHKLPMGKNAFFLSTAGEPGPTPKVLMRHSTVQGGAAAAVVTSSAAGMAVEGGKTEKPVVKTEPLGKQTIEGVQVEGTRSTVTIPAGAIGNELPISTISERWYSPELQTVVMSKRSDPRFGETVYRLTNLQRSEPQATLFEVPSDYTVQENDLMNKKWVIKETENK